MRKTIYISPVVAALLGYTQALFQPAPTQQNGTLCSGTYYEGINSMYLDCYDSLGNLVSQDESHYEFSLDNTCTQDTYGDLQANLTGWLVPTDLSTNTTVNCCDYYQRTVGYVFTQCDQGINVVVFPDRVSSNTSASYQNMTTEYAPLDWNWDELTTLLNSYCSASQSSSGSGSGSNSTMDNSTSGNSSGTDSGSDMNMTTSGSDTNSTPSSTGSNSVPISGSNSTDLSQNWQNLNFSWSDLLANATANPDMSLWDLGNYSYWIQTYDQIQEALQQYLVTNGQMDNVTYVPLWQDAWNDPSTTLDTVLGSLNGTDPFNAFTQWFSDAFGPNGYVTTGLNQGQTGGSTGNTTSSGNSTAPSQSDLLQQIVAWISANVDTEVQQQCTACQQNQSSGNTSNSTGGSGSVTLPPLNSTNYTAPTGCQVSPDGMTIVCSDNSTGNAVTVPFDQINAFRSNFSQTGFCTGILQAEQNCSIAGNNSQSTSGSDTNGTSTGSDDNSTGTGSDTNSTGSSSGSGLDATTQCLQTGVYDAMTSVGNANIYGLLFFDAAQRQELDNACQQLIGSTFNIPQSQFDEIFGFDFGNLNNGSSNGTSGNGTGSGSTGNSTDNSTSGNVTVPTIDATTYQPPANCTLSSDQSTIQCNDQAGDAVNVPVTDFNTWATQDDVSTLCTDTVNSYDICSQTSGATPPCVSQNLYNVMSQLESIGEIYAFLYFDQNVRDEIYPLCSQLLGSGNFTLDQSQWDDAFTFQFGDLTGGQ